MCKQPRYRVLLAAVVLVSLVPARALAQRSGGPIDLQLFRPAIDSKGLITLDGSQVLGHLDLSFGLILNYASGPLSMRRFRPAGQIPGIANAVTSRYDVDHMVTGNLQAAIGLLSHFEVGLGMPLTFWTGELSPETDNNKIDAQGAGDLALHVKARILNTSKHPIGLSVLASLTFPTGDKNAFLGSGRVTLSPTLIVDKELLSGRLHLAANIGAIFRLGNATENNPANGWRDTRNPCANGSAADCGSGALIESEHNLRYGVGASLAIVKRRFDFVAELVGQTGLSGFADRERFNSAHELIAGFKLYLARSSYFTFGVGRGLRPGGGNHQYGSPTIRGFVGFIFEPSIGDRDGDGLKDDVDKCPDAAEDFDDFEDEDGCPDPDNDRDGILDVDDHCPNEPEDKDGFEDKDGCPDPDNDKDGILDKDDKCPNEPETYNGYRDKDGCPDKPLLVTSGRIQVFEKIYFRTNQAVIKKVSYAILDAVAASLASNPDIVRVEIQGHADERGSDAYNLELTDRRAKAVRTYLMGKGVAGKRLVGKGYGERVPIDRGHNAAAWSKNRRVEFVIRKRAN